MRDELVTGIVPELMEMFQASGIEFREPPSLLARKVDGIVVGGFAMTGHSVETIHMHYVGAHRRWMNRKLLHLAFSFCFDQLGVKVVLAFLAPERLHARDVAIKLGFKVFGGQIPGVGIHMLTMVREDCRWLDLSSRGWNG